MNNLCSPGFPNNHKEINIIVACGHNRVIGNNGKLPWSIKEDWDYFMNTTLGGSMIMGRTCYREFEPFAKEREVIGLTRNQNYKFPHAKTANSLKQALSLTTKKTIWICGGERLYEEAMTIGDRLYITLIENQFKGDVFFPPWEHTFTRLVSKKEVSTKEGNLKFLVYDKLQQKI